MNHEITCGYWGGPGEPYYQPATDCSCGFSTGRRQNWKECGELMDEHIERITLARKLKDLPTPTPGDFLGIKDGNK